MKIVWHCADRLGAEMAGPAIRAVELCRRLAEHHELALFGLGASELKGEPFATHEYAPVALREAAGRADAFAAQGFGFPLSIALALRGRLVLDLYDPVQLEQLSQFGPQPSPAQRISLAHVRARLLALLARADHILCASSQQRAFWLGWLGAVGRLAPQALQSDPGARRLVAVAPFGLSEEPPLATEAPLRRELAIPLDAPLALFWGGLWDWMDPALAVRAVAELRARGRVVHLVFLAGGRPGGDIMRDAADEARRCVRDLGLSDQVHFLANWIPYARRGPVLLDADVAVTAHRPSLEAELAFRTRLLDCLWARLPVACTRGDALAAEAEREGWGTVADPGDAVGLANAIAALLEPAAREQARAAMGAARERYQWSRSARAILDLLDHPAPARSPFYVPGEMAGERAFEIARALGGKLWRRMNS
ncbi:MAG TPA: glycosyltransferase [Anaeromyxobacteraceae bacterium]|nr:glycosyltransferase [Anaeromyxobacteraceae bacterium]